MDILDKKNLIKIAHYYFIDGMTQSEIAKKLHLSRQKVNRLIKESREKGIVKIEIATMENSYVELESYLEKEFAMDRVIVVHVENESSLIGQLGKAGAEYLAEVLKEDSFVGVSWGKTLHSVANHLKGVNKRDSSVVQLVGGINSTISTDLANEITRQFARGLGGHPYYMYAPAIIKNEQLKKSFLAEQSIQDVFEIIEKSEVAVVGIGELSSQSTIYEQNYLDKNVLEKLEKQGAVGDICFQMFDIQGNSIEVDSEYQVIGISKEQLVNIPNVIGIAGGPKKVKAIIGAMKSQMMNVLIIDSITATLLKNSAPE